MAERVLFVCTANQCRSPMAEVLARAAFSRRGLDVETSSAGLFGSGVEASEGSIEEMERLGLNLEEHRSRSLTPNLVDHADLIVTMERRHLGAIAELSIDAVERSFPLRELVRIGRAREPGESVRDWALGVGAGRDPSRVLAIDPSDDVRDPMGGPRRAYRRCANELAALVEELTALLAPG